MLSRRRRCLSMSGSSSNRLRAFLPATIAPCDRSGPLNLLPLRDGLNGLYVPNGGCWLTDFTKRRRQFANSLSLDPGRFCRSQ